MDIRNFFGGGGGKTAGNKNAAKVIQPNSKPSKKPSPTAVKPKSRAGTKQVKTPLKSEKSINRKSETKTPEKTKVIGTPEKENTERTPKQDSKERTPKHDTKVRTNRKSASSKKDSSKLDTAKSKKLSVLSDSEVEIIDSDSDNFQGKQQTEKHQKSGKDTKRSKSKDKNGNVQRKDLSSPSPEPVRQGKRSKKSAVLESSDEEIVPRKKNKKSAKKPKKGIIFDSDEEEEDPIPKPKKERSRKKKSLYISDSDEECRQTKIEDVFQKSSAKPPSSKSGPEAHQKSTPQKKMISVADFFGATPVHRTETKTPAKRKADSSPQNNNDPGLEIHDDDDFEETLRQLDQEDEGHKAKKQRLSEEMPSAPKSLASKLSDRVKAGFKVEETPEKKAQPKLTSPIKLSPGVQEKGSPGKATPGRAMPKKSPVKVSPPGTKQKTPQKTPDKKTSPSAEKTPLEKKPTAYRSYLAREGPRALGSKEIPEGAENCLEGLAFVITGILESMERDESKTLVERYGGKVTGSISKKTSYIVVGRDAGESKLAKANQLGTKQIDEDGLLDLVRTLPGKKSKYLAAAEKEASKATPGKPKLSSSTSRVQTPSNKFPASPASMSLPTTPRNLSTPATPKLSASAGASPQTPSRGVSGGGESLMWVDKYKPTTLKQIIGQQGDKSNAKKLLQWLKAWHRNVASGKKPTFNRFNDDGSGSRAALLSGPPGVGKTTTAHLVCEEAAFSFVELNASDTRSKKSLKQEVAESLNNQSLSGYFGAATSSEQTTDSKSHCLVMDEVDGMAGNEDRGGMQELIGLIKNTKIPIICMCNDRNHPKIRSLANHCFDLRFQRPRVEQIKAAMMSMVYKEGLKVPAPALNEIILASNQDVRQVIHNLSMWSASEKNLTYDQLKKDASNAKKDMKLGPFDVVRKVFAGGEETAKMTINDKSDLFFHDYSFGPLFVQENYISVTPLAARGDTKKHLELLSRAADSLAISDTIDRKIRGQGNWNLLPLQAIFASVLPGEAMRGYMGQQIQFPQWLGRNSTRSKNDRILQELKAHMKLKVFSDKKGLNLDYLPHFRKFLTRPLINEGSDGVPEAIENLNAYDLLKEDFDSILEVSQWPNSFDPMSKVETKVKAAFTRAYNKESHLTPYATGNLAKKGRKRGGGGAEEDDLDPEGEGRPVESEEEEDDVKLDSMIKAKKAKSGKPAASKGQGGETTKGKGGAKGGQAKGRGKKKS